ncbi:MAG: DUF3592 domain-containing protein [Siphonobacter sp.]
MLFSAILMMSLPRTPGMSQPGAEFMLPFLGIAVAFVALGYYFATRRQQWLQHSDITEGVIVGVYKKYNRDDKMGNFPHHFPRVSFHVNGNQFLTQGAEASNGPFQIGEKVSVRYNLENPEEAILAAQDIPGINPRIFYILGALFVVIGMLFAL